MELNLWTFHSLWRHKNENYAQCFYFLVWSWKYSLHSFNFHTLLTFKCRLTIHQYDHTGLCLPDTLLYMKILFCIKALLGLTLTNNLGSCSSFSALMLWWCQGQSRTLRREAGLTQCSSRRLGWNTASGKSKTTPLPPRG